MHLSPAQLKRFTRLFYSLLIYANDKYGVLGGAFTPWEDDGIDQIALLTQFVFEDHRAVIGEYLADNPDEYADSALAQVALWEKAAFAEAFFVVEVSRECTTLMGDECLFNVTGLDEEATVDLGRAGEATFTVLLPFEDRIVYGIATSPVPGSFDDIRDEIAADALGMLAEGLVVNTVEDFMRVGPGCVERSLARRAVEMIAFGDSMDGLPYSTPEDLRGSGPQAPGTHVGALAGMPQDERDAAIEAYMDKDVPQLARVFGDLGERCYSPHAPVRTLADTFAMLAKQDLTELAQHYGIRGYSKMSKARLSEKLAAELTSPSRIDDVMSYLSENEGSFDLAQQAFRAGGVISTSAAENANQPLEQRWRPCPPFMNVFVYNNEITCVIPKEVMAVLTDESWEKEDVRRARLRHAHHLANTYMEMCGIAAVDELASIYLRYYPGEMSRREFERFVVECGEREGGAFDTWTWHRRLHVISYDFISPDEDDSLDVAADIDGDAFGNRPTEAERLRRELAQRHEKIEIWEAPGKTAAALEAFNWDRSVAAQPSYRALQAFLDAHVPNGKDDYFFADKMLEDMRSMINFGAGPDALASYMQSQGLVLDKQAESAQLLLLLSVFANDMPRWENNGWSAKELEEHKEKK